MTLVAKFKTNQPLRSSGSTKLLAISEWSNSRGAYCLKTGSWEHELKALQTPSVDQPAQESLVDVRGVRHRQLLQAFDRGRFLANQRPFVNKVFETYTMHRGTGGEYLVLKGLSAARHCERPVRHGMKHKAQSFRRLFGFARARVPDVNLHLVGQLRPPSAQCLLEHRYRALVHSNEVLFLIRRCSVRGLYLTVALQFPRASFGLTESSASVLRVEVLLTSGVLLVSVAMNLARPCSRRVGK